MFSPKSLVTVIFAPNNKIRFLGLLAVLFASVSAPAVELGYPEKEELTFGFIKLTDMAPIAIAYENGYFEDEGLYVTIEAQANWKVLLDGVIDGRLDGAHMLAGQPLACLLYTSPSPRDQRGSRMPSSA